MTVRPDGPMRAAPTPAPTAPGGARVAGALFVIYSVAAVLNAAGAETGVGWVGGRVLPRAIVRLLATVVVAWGLSRGARWAWWLGIVAGTVWFLTSAAAVVVLDHGDLHWLQPSSYQIFLVVSLASLGMVLALLLSSEVRAAFREPRA